jgi:uncharacterized protein YbjT (DUF2867 family)
LRIGIAGATGLVGGRALALALADPRIERVVAPTRRPLPHHPRLDNPPIGAPPRQADAPWGKVDGIACALGTTRARAGSAEAFRAVDFGLVLAVATSGLAAGARRFALVSSMGADARSLFLYPRTKGEIEAALIGLGYDSLTQLRPGLLGGDREEHRRGERIAAALLRLVGPILPRTARISPATVVARALVEAAVAGKPGVHWVKADRLAG